MVLDMSNVIKRFGERLALDYFSLRIEEGEIVGLLGPNGAGKTTCIKSILGLVPVDEGEIRVFGREHKNSSLEIKRQIGYVTQEVTVYEDMSAKENMAFFGSLYGLKGRALQDRISSVAGTIGLESRLGDKPKQFSGGMKRRLNIGCSLLHEPRFLIMDEPTVGIDPQSRNYILEFVRQIAAEGTTILYTSHYIEEVEAIADRVIIMDQGHHIAGGTMQELVARIQGDSHVLIDVKIAREDKLAEIQALPDIKEATLSDNQYHIIVAGGAYVIDRILAILTPLGIKNVNSKQPNLEDVFLTLTGKQLRDGDGE